MREVCTAAPRGARCRMLQRAKHSVAPHRQALPAGASSNPTSPTHADDSHQGGQVGIGGNIQQVGLPTGMGWGEGKQQQQASMSGAWPHRRQRCACAVPSLGCQVCSDPHRRSSPTDVHALALAAHAWWALAPRLRPYLCRPSAVNRTGKCMSECNTHSMGVSAVGSSGVGSTRGSSTASTMCTTAKGGEGRGQ